MTALSSLLGILHVGLLSEDMATGTKAFIGAGFSGRD